MTGTAELMRRDAAEELNQITVACTEKLGRARDIVMANCEGHEAQQYMRSIAEVLAAISMLAGPSYPEYPDLTPPELRDQERRE
jgi:hypothetical protein